jgi:hypothetical protein
VMLSRRAARDDPGQPEALLRRDSTRLATPGATGAATMSLPTPMCRGSWARWPRPSPNIVRTRPEVPVRFRCADPDGPSGQAVRSTGRSSRAAVALCVCL